MRFITPIAVFALVALMVSGFVACGEAKEKAIEELKSKLTDIDVASFTKQAEAAPADVKSKVTGMISELTSKKTEAMGLVDKLKDAATGDYAGLLQKAKDAVSGCTGIVDKIKAALGK